VEECSTRQEITKLLNRWLLGAGNLADVYFLTAPPKPESTTSPIMEDLMYGTTVCLHELLTSAISTATASDDVRLDIWRSKIHGVMLTMYHEQLA
jgi:hypothetical protein